jgi:6-phosphogluconolactonase
MKIHVFRTLRELLSAMADYFTTAAHEAISSRGEFNVALSGGSSPVKLYEMLASPPFKNRINWEKTNFFFGDERYVPKASPENNAHMAAKALFDPLMVSRSRIFSVDTTLPPHEAAMDYAAKISDHFEGGDIAFDLILLGLGENAHTASLFPDTPVLHEKLASIKAFWLDRESQYRISMTAPLINQARHIAFFVFGETKSNAVHHVLGETTDPEKYPAQLIHPVDGDLQWFLDEAAASLLNNKMISRN